MFLNTSSAAHDTATDLVHCSCNLVPELRSSDPAAEPYASTWSWLHGAGHLSHFSNFITVRFSSTSLFCILHTVKEWLYSFFLLEAQLQTDLLLDVHNSCNLCLDLLCNKLIPTYGRLLVKVFTARKINITINKLFYTYEIKWRYHTWVSHCEKRLNLFFFLISLTL